MSAMWNEYAERSPPASRCVCAIVFSRYPSWPESFFRSSRSRSSKCFKSFLVSNVTSSFSNTLDPDPGALAVERPFLDGAVHGSAGLELFGQHLVSDVPLEALAGPGEAGRELPGKPDPVRHVELGALAERLDPVRELADEPLRPEILVQGAVDGDREGPVGLGHPGGFGCLLHQNVFSREPEGPSSRLDLPPLARQRGPDLIRRRGQQLGGDLLHGAACLLPEN